MIFIAFSAKQKLILDILIHKANTIKRFSHLLNVAKALQFKKLTLWGQNDFGNVRWGLCR